MKKTAFVCCIASLLLLSACGRTEAVTTNTGDTVIVRSQYAPGERKLPEVEPFDPMDIQTHTTPGSTCFSRIGYDAEREILLVQFRDGGKYYAYIDLPESVYDDFTSADSLGGYYNKYIKGVYASEKME